MPDEVFVDTEEPSSSGRRRSKPGRGAPRASVACVSCRQKKTKCDAINTEPGMRCTACRNTNSKCVIIRNDDRRKYGSRGHIATLQGRINSIEAFISEYQGSAQSGNRRRAHHLPSEEPSEESIDYIAEDPNAEFGARSEASHGEPHDERTPMSLHSAAEQAGNAEKDRDDTSFQFDYQSAAQVPSNPQIDPHSLPRDGNHPAESPTAFAPYLTPGVEEQAPSLNADASPGQVRHYGPTTQLYIQSPSDTRTAMPVNPNPECDFLVNMDSPQLRKRLLHSCWDYYSWSVRVVDGELFTAHRAIGKRSQYYSMFLEHCLLACATRISTSNAIRSLGRAYADRAKKDIVQELEQPTLGSLAGFLLLSDFEATMARDRAGWIYSGIACRLLFDLGLHEDCSHLVQNGVLSKDDEKMRRILFHGAVIFDRLWALYLGRPSCIPAAALQATRLTVSSAADPDPDILQPWVALCGHISKVTDILNAPGMLANMNAANHLQDVDDEIVASYNALPVEMSSQHCQISELEQGVYGLNIQFRGIRIVLHRALIRALCTQPIRNQGAYAERIAKSRAIMHDNAVSICRLILAYREIYGVQNIITIMLDNMYTAASVLVSHILQPPTGSVIKSVSDEHQLLKILFETIESLQKHYPVSEKMLDTLWRITCNTEIAGLFGKQSASMAVIEPSPKPFTDPSFLSQPIGSWGSLEALMNDDFILGHNNTSLNGPGADAGLGDTTWLNGVNLGPMR